VAGACRGTGRDLEVRVITLSQEQGWHGGRQGSTNPGHWALPWGRGWDELSQGVNSLAGAQIHGPCSVTDMVTMQRGLYLRQ